MGDVKKFVSVTKEGLYVDVGDEKKKMENIRAGFVPLTKLM